MLKKYYYIKCNGRGTISKKMFKVIFQHYTEVLGAKVLKGQRMYIDEFAAKMLIKKYLER